MTEKIEESKEEFAQKMSQIISEHYDDFDYGDKYYGMREVFDRNVTRETMKRTHKVIPACKQMGVNYRTFRKMKDS